MAKGLGDDDVSNDKDEGDKNDDDSTNSSTQTDSQSLTRGDSKRNMELENEELGGLSKALVSLVDVEKKSASVMSDLKKSFMHNVEIGEKRTQLVELSKLKGLSPDEIVEASAAIGLDDKKLELFLSMPDEFKIEPVDGKSDLENGESIARSSSELTRKGTLSLDFDTSPLQREVSNSRFWKKLKIGPFGSVYTVLIKAKINVLLPFGPLAILLHYLTHKNGWVFFFSLLGITPVAERLGYATEQLAFFTGSTVGGLLTVTFGNAMEMIFSIYALKVGMVRVVQQSLLGSILSNMLLVLGCAFFAGGVVHRRKVQCFNRSAALMNSGLLLMAVMGITFPAVLHFTHNEAHFRNSELWLSRFNSCIMLMAYAGYLYFQLRSQHNLYDPIDEETAEDTDDDDEVPELTYWESISWLAILTLWVLVLSGYLVDATQGASEFWNILVTFINVILIPLEHAGAIMCAVKDKLDITLGVAIGSSTRISMFVIPFCVVIGWMMGQPMYLNFQLFDIVILFLAVLLVAFMLQEGTSNYFKGLVLVLCYFIVAASLFVQNDLKEE